MINLNSKKGMVSWSGVLVAMAISLFIVAGLSFTLHVVTQKITKARIPDSDSLVYSWLARSASIQEVNAVTQYSTLDRSAYYNSNKDAYTGKGRTYFSIVKGNTKTSTTKSSSVVATKKVTTVKAATPKVVIASTTASKSVSATRLIQSASTMSLGKKGTANLMIGLKNTGSTVWPSQGLSLRSSSATSSYLAHSSWASTTVVKDWISNAKPGELIYIAVTIEAPDANGVYTDTFYLSYAGQKVSGTDTTLTVVVGSGVPDTQISSKSVPVVSTVSNVVPTAPTVISDSGSGTFSATKLIQSATNLTIGQLQAADFQIGWKNTGTATWKAGETPIRIRSSARVESYLHHSTWDDGVWVATLKTDVKPGEVIYTPFKVEAPTSLGNYNETFTLYRGSVPLSSATAVLSVQVVKGAPKVQIAQEGIPTPIIDTPIVNAPVITPTVGSSVVDAITESESNIRVGIFNSREPIKVTANKPFDVRNGQGQIIAALQAGSIATVSFDFAQKIYTLTTDSLTTTSPTYLRFVGTGSPLVGLPDQDTIFEIVSYTDHPGWSSTLNDNRFRAVVEVRYSESKDRVWLINDLSLEKYLKGSGETSNSSPYEFQKSLVIAARTYAKIVMRTNKYPGENFNVRNTDADQVYRGYGAEVRMPQFSRAVDETKGIVVMYNGSIVITPYFSNSDGRTRSWEEVWAGSAKPWLKSVDDPFCAGLKLWGHGVGMSARGAVAMAAAGSTFGQILTHYYTGIQLTRIY